MQQAQYQLIIVGGGPAGLTAGLYAARGRLKVLLIEKGATGGQVLVTDWVDNYPGFAEGVSGFDLMDKMTAHADRFGLEKKFAVITALDLAGDVKSVTLESGEILTAKTIILCTGAKPRRLDVPESMNTADAASRTAPPATAPFTATRKLPLSAAATPPFRKPCT